MTMSIGVVIPAYNAEAFIEEALDSVAAQTLRPDAVVVVDDGSRDGTAERVETWTQGSPLTLTLVKQQNGGVSRARNEGIRRLDTELVALLDADDIWEPFHLERMAKGLAEVPGLVVAFANHRMFDSLGIVSQDFLAGKAVHGLPYDDSDGGIRILRGGVFGSLLEGNYIPPTTSVFRRAAAIRIGCFDESLRHCEDRDFFLRLSREGRFGFFPEPHARYRLHPDNASRPDQRSLMKAASVRVVCKMARLGQELRLSREELAETHHAARRQGAELLYVMSERGVYDYGRAVPFLLRLGVLSPIFDPRHPARAVRSLFRGPPPEPAHRWTPPTPPSAPAAEQRPGATTGAIP